jgi:hypothetical protein
MAHKLFDYRISAVPPFPGLRHFPDGHDFKQWMGDNSKALMKVCDYLIGLSIAIHTYKVFLAAIAGYVPSGMVRCVAAFMGTFYIAHWNAINSLSLKFLEDCVKTFHQLCSIFVDAGVPISLSLPRQHTLKHLYHAIHLFGSPNGLCSSITESKHITAI